MDTKLQSEKGMDEPVEGNMGTPDSPVNYSINNVGYASSTGAHTHGSGIGSATPYVQTGGVMTGGGFTTVPNYAPYQQQYPQQYPQQWIAPEPALALEDVAAAIEFIENLMFLLVATLDECDVPNQGGTMDRTEGAKIESVIDLGGYEIIIRPKLV